MVWASSIRKTGGTCNGEWDTRSDSLKHCQTHFELINEIKPYQILLPYRFPINPNDSKLTSYPKSMYCLINVAPLL